MNLSEDIMNARDKVAKSISASMMKMLAFDVMQAFPELLIMIDKDQNILFASEAWYRAFGFRPYEVIGSKFMDFVVEKDKERTLDAWENGSSGEFTNRYICKDNSSKSITWKATNIERDNIIIAWAALSKKN